MSLTAEQTNKVVSEYQRAPGDTGSPEVQVALLSARIEHLKGHFDQHKKDHHSRRGLIMLVAKRKSLLSYIAKRDIQRYRDVVASLGLRK